MRRYKEVLIKGLMMGLMLVGLFGFSALAGEEWLTDFNQAKEEAAEKKLPILIDFTGSDWCSWCIKLDQEVFSQNEFKEYARTIWSCFWPISRVSMGKNLRPK